MLKGQIADQERVHDHAERPQIHHRAEETGGAEDQLGGRVLQTAGDGSAGLGGADDALRRPIRGALVRIGRVAARVAARFVGDEFGKTKVTEEEVAAFDGGVRPGEVDQTVLQLEVSVHDADVVVEVANGGGELVRVAAGEIAWEALSVRADEVEEGAAGI